MLERLGEWGQRWAVDRLGPDDLDAGLLMWGMHRAVDVGSIPERRVVVQFDFRGLPKERYWYILQRPDIEVCLKDYGFDVDLFVTADLMALTKVHLGRLDVLRAIEEGLVELDGPMELRRAFPAWMGLNAFAKYGRPLPVTGIAPS